MKYPIFLINRNLLSSTKKLVEDLYNLGETNLHIIDNASTYPPLLEWYKEQTLAKVHYHENLGERALWNSNLINEIDSPYYIISDSDIELNPNTPKTLIQDMISLMEKYDYTKIGLSLSLDFPQDNDYQKFSWEWEQKFWQEELEPDLYRADVDTTFCLFKKGEFTYRSLRMAGDYTARHLPWHKDLNNLSQEDIYYLQHSSNTSTFKRHYEEISKFSEPNN